MPSDGLSSSVTSIALSDDMMRDILDIRLGGDPTTDTPSEDGEKQASAATGTEILTQKGVVADATRSKAIVKVGVPVATPDEPAMTSNPRMSEGSMVGAYAVSGNNTNSDTSNSGREEEIQDQPGELPLFGDTPATLVTAAEVYEDTSEEFRRKEAAMEESIRQRLMASAVQANVVVEIPAGDNRNTGVEHQHSETKPATNSRQLMLLLGLVVVILLVAAAVGISLAFRNKDTNDPPINNAEDLPTLSPTPQVQLGDNWPPADTVIATVPETLCLERMPEFGVTRLCVNTTQDRGSGVTNLVAASRLWNMRQYEASAEVSILNAAEVRTDIAAGDFTVADGQALLPYNNTLVLVQMEGKSLITAMERALQKIVDDYALIDEGKVSGGSYPYGAGIRWDVNMSESFPRRLSNIQVNPKFLTTEESGWLPFNESKTFSVVTSSWLAQGGDGYNEFHRLDQAQVQDTGVDALSGWIDYCQEHKVLLDPPVEHYSTQTYTNLFYNWTWTWDD